MDFFTLIFLFYARINRLNLNYWVSHLNPLVIPNKQSERYSFSIP